MLVSARVTHATGSRELDLHQPVIARADRTRIASTLTLDNAAYQIFRHVVRGGMAGDQCIKIAVGIETRDTLLLRECRRGGKHNQNRRECEFANHSGSGLQMCVVGKRGFSFETQATL
jgi:hypothetical protein